MTTSELDQLAQLIRRERETFLAHWRKQVRQLPSAKHLDTPTLNDHMPGVLDELATALERRMDQSIPQALRDGSPHAHGLQRLNDDFDLEEVVAEYNILRGCIHDLAVEHRITLQGRPFHILNRVFDSAIGVALETYVTQRAAEVQRRREEYLAFVAHDLRTPLAAISMAGTVLEQSLPTHGYGPGSARMLKILRRSVQSLELLVLKVLEENTLPESGSEIKLEKRQFDLWPLVEALINDLRPICESSKTLLVNEVPDDLVVFADASALRRIFQNLLANAIRYTPNGEVVVGARPLIAENAVECWVSDNGAGVPENLLHTVFEKGVTDPENPGGSGLGLAIVQTFTEAHGGKVSVQSTPGAGSIFRFWIPARSASEAQKAAPSGAGDGLEPAPA